MIVFDVDFDFFVRENPALDWGHGENGIIGAFGDILWRQRAIDAICRGVDLGRWQNSPSDPAPGAFWEIMETMGWDFSQVKAFIIGDSHAETGKALYDLYGDHFYEDSDMQLYHFDAHHDLGYSPEATVLAQEGVVACDFWIRTLAYNLSGFGSLHQVYPEWRDQKGGYVYPVDCAEMDAGSLIQLFDNFTRDGGAYYWSITVGCTAVTAPVEPVDIVMLTKSSAWTPPWCDGQWEDFIANKPERASARTHIISDTSPRWPATDWPGVVHMLTEEANTHREMYDAMADALKRREESFSKLSPAPALRKLWEDDFGW